jgi:putative nucleotidyltransferase with HDIG domain
MSNPPVPKREPPSSLSPIVGATRNVTLPSANLAAALMEEAHRAAASGRRALARQRYEGALYLLRDASESGTASAILRRVGRTYLDDGDVEAGLDCLYAAQAVAEASGNLSEVAHTVNAIGTSYWQRGQLEESARLYQESGRLAREAGDERLLAMVEQNIGILASMHGEMERALEHYALSLDLYRKLDLPEEVARLLSNVGLLQAKLERWSDAELTYAEASTLAKDAGDNWTRLMVEVNRVALFIGRGNFEQAKFVCDRVLLEAGALGETRILAETYKHCGVIARESADLDEADRYLRMAYEQATSRQDLLLAAETAREQAELYLAQGRNRETLQALSLSHRLFTSLRAQQDLDDVRRRLRSLENRFHDLVRKWAQDIESKDEYTFGHCERVADYACAVAGELGFDETQLFWFRVGALLHDVGKIVVSVEILNKPGALTPEERKIMERHPVAGAELLRDVEFPWDVIPMIRGHHERWDGHGYPDQLAGEDIPLAARILCVADVYDALSSHRPYRKAFEPREALRLMQADSGRHFDPDILSRFVRIVLNDIESGPAPATEPKFNVRRVAPRVSQPRRALRS